MPDRHDTGSSRRSFLKSADVAVAGIGVVPLASANKSTSERFEEALEIRKRYDMDLDEWYSYIESLWIQFGNSMEDHTVRLPDGDDGGPSTQVIAPFEPGDLTLVMTYYPLGDEWDAIELRWSFENGFDDSYTGRPKDLVKIGFQPDHYYKPDEKDGEEAITFGSDMSMVLQEAG